MLQDEWIRQLDEDIKEKIEDYVQNLDFHAIETPLKTAQQYKNELRDKLIRENNFEALSRGIFNAVNLIDAHLITLNDEAQYRQVREEINQAFTTLKEIYRQFSLQKPPNKELADRLKLNDQISLWKALYGVSDETLLLIYDIVLACFKNNEIQNCKDLLQVLLLIAPIIPSYWNALGFAYQKEGNHDQALNCYLVAEEIGPEILETHFYLARCYKALNQKPLAREQVEKLVKLVERSKELQERLGAQLEQLAYEVTNNN